MHREVILGKSCENKSSITEQIRGKGARGKDIQRPRAHDESCCTNPSTEDASAGDVDDRVDLTVCKNCIVGLLLGEEGVRRDMKLLVLVVLLELVTEQSVVDGGFLVVLFDVFAGLLVIGSLDFSADAALSGVVGSQHLRNVITEVESGTEVASGMAVELLDWLASSGLNPERVAMRKTSGELNLACRCLVSCVPESCQVWSVC